MTLSKDDIETLATGAGKSPAALFGAVHEVAARRVGAGLVTMMRHRPKEADVERLWSSNEQAYPSGGRKPKRDTDWSREVLTAHRVLVSTGDDGIRKSFPDHAIIRGLGLHSCVNVPLVSEGQCIGTLNVLRAQPDWSEEEVTLVRVLGLVTLSGVLMLRT
jgi:GAF domain-containing protein